MLYKYIIYIFDKNQRKELKGKNIFAVFIKSQTLCLGKRDFSITQASRSAVESCSDPAHRPSRGHEPPTDVKDNP